MRRSKRATLSEVARQAGVSPATVSLVMGGKAGQHRISSDTLLRVQKAAAELDYSPNLLVRSLKDGRTHILSFFNAFRRPREADDLYMARLSSALEAQAGEMGYDVLFHCDFNRAPEETYRFLNGGRTDGVLLFAPEEEEPLLPLLRNGRLPVVLVNGRDSEGVLASVQDDLEAGMQLVASELVQRGHRHIAVITEPTQGHRDMHLRVQVLRDSLRTYGVEVPESYVVPFTTEAMEAFLRNPPTPRPTALFCWRDRIAYFVLEACDRLRISVPEQLSVVGYDGILWPGATRHVAASVHVNVEAVGQAAVRLLLDRIGGESVEWEKRLPVTFDAGTTLAPARLT